MTKINLVKGEKFDSFIVLSVWSQVAYMHILEIFFETSLGGKWCVCISATTFHPLAHLLP